MDLYDRKLGQLDALRGIAILGVILVHSAWWGPQHILSPSPQILANVAFSGQRGVQLFFMVSAFTLYLSNSHRSGERRPTLNFFIRRFARISPMLWLATLLSLIIWPKTLGGTRDAVISLSYLSSFVPSALDHGAKGSWSVGTEAAFYMTLPFLFRWVRTPYSALRTLLVVFTLNYAGIPAMIRAYGNEDYWRFKSLAGNAPVFLMGIVGYFLWRTLVVDRKMPAGDRRTISLALLTASWILYLYAFPFSADRVVSQSATVFIFMMAVIIQPWRLFVNRFTIFLGKLSFSIYLLHFYVGHLAERLLTSLGSQNPNLASPTLEFAAKGAFTLLVTLPLAYLTYRFVESPGIRLGRYLIARIEGQAKLKYIASPSRSLMAASDSDDAQF